MTDSPDWTGNIQISGQSVVVNENISGQTVAVYSGSQYAPVQGNAVYLNGGANVAPGVSATCVSYTVPAGKTFYVQGMGHNNNGQSGTKNMQVDLQDGVVVVLQTGSFQGDGTVFDTPIIFAAGHTVKLVVTAWGGAGSQAVEGSLWGWLG